MPVLSWHQVQTAGDLAAAWRQVQEAGVLPEDRVRLGVMGDGAEWSWQHVEALLPQACQGLGYYPGGEYLHQVANAPYSDSLRALQWVEATLPRLYLGKVGQGLGGLRRRQPTSAEALQAMDNGWVSLNSHRGRTYYRRLRRGG